MRCHMRWSLLTSAGSYAAYTTCLVSVAVSVLAAAAAFTVAVIASSTATLALAVHCVLDGLCSVLVLWRFFGGGILTPDSQLETREKRASVGIAIAFVALAISVGTISAAGLSTKQTSTNAAAVVGLALPCLLMFTLLGLVKLRLGISTRSGALKKAAACSLFAAALSLIVGLSAPVMQANPAVWYIDALIALLVAVGLLGYSSLTLVKNARQRNAWWTTEFWLGHGSYKFAERTVARLLSSKYSVRATSAARDECATAEKKAGERVQLSKAQGGGKKVTSTSEDCTTVVADLDISVSIVTPDCSNEC